MDSQTFLKKMYFVQIIFVKNLAFKNMWKHENILMRWWKFRWNMKKNENRINIVETGEFLSKKFCSSKNMKNLLINKKF